MSNTSATHSASMAGNTRVDVKTVALNCVKSYEANPSAYIQDVVKQALSSFYSTVLNAEFLAHLGYEKSSSGTKDSSNRRNGFVHKKVRSSFGALDIMVPRDRDGSFNPIAVRKHSRAVTSTESKVLTMFARGMCDEDIALTVQKMYSMELPSEKVHIIQRRILMEVHDGEYKPLRSTYAFVLLARIDFKVKQIDSDAFVDIALYIMHGVAVNGDKEILDMFLCPPGPKTNCITMLDNLRQRGVEDIMVLLTEGIASKEKDVQTIFPHTTVY